jgi:hypothetical protein
VFAGLAIAPDLLGQPASQLSRAAKEAFLSSATIVGGLPSLPSATYARITLDDGTTKRNATIQAARGSAATLNVAAYELDKILGLNFVAPAVVRPVNGQPAVVIWWLDGVVMDELSRRKGKTEPPDLDAWNKQFQVMRIFDELVANEYRDPNPALDLSTVWDNLLITKSWEIWLVDHTRTFQTRRSLNHPESLTQCDRSLLRTLKGLNVDAFTSRLANYVSTEQIESLESRRRLLVQHFDGQIARQGESAVLYDLPPRP